MRNPALLANLTITIGPAQTDVTGTIALTAEGAALLPDRTTAELDGIATAEQLFGQIDLETGAVTLAASRADLHVGDAVQVSATGGVDDPATPEPENPGLRIVIDPFDPDPSAEIATVRNLAIEIDGFPASFTELTRVDELTIRRDGFHIVKTVGTDEAPFDFTFGQAPLALAIDDAKATLTLDVVVATGEAPVVTGGVDITARSASLVGATLGDDDPTDGVPGIHATYDFESGALAVDAREFSATLGGLLEVEAHGLRFAIDPNAAADTPLFTLDRATARIDALEAGGLVPTAELEGFGLRQNGRFLLLGAEIVTPRGYVNALGIAGLLPLEIDRLSIDFPDLDDLDTFTLGAEGRFLIDELDGLLPFRPIIHIGDTDVEPGDDITFDVDLDIASLRQGRLAPRSFGPITLGVEDLVVGNVTLSGEIALGRYENGVFDGAVSGFLDIDASDDPNQLGLHLSVPPPGDPTAPASRLTIDETGADLDLTMRVTAGNATLDFGLDVETTFLEDSPFIRIDRFEPTLGSLTLGELEFEIENILRVTAHDVQFLSGQPIASLGDLRFELLAFPDLDVTTTVTSFELFDDPGVDGDRRVQIGSIDLILTGEIGDPALLELLNFRLHTNNLSVNLETGAFDLAGLELLADGAALFPTPGAPALDGIATLTDGSDADALALRGVFDADGDVTFTFDTLTVTAQDVAGLTATGGELAFGPNAADRPLLHVDSSRLTLDFLGEGVEIEVTDFEIARDGGLSATEVELRSGTALETLGLAGLFPFAIDLVRFAGGAPGDRIELDDFTVDVVGRVTVPIADLGFGLTPVLMIGDQSVLAGDPFPLTFHVRNGAVTLDTELITLGFTDLPVGSFTAEAFLELGRYEDGVFRVGHLDDDGDFVDGLAGSATLTADNGNFIGVELAGNITEETVGGDPVTRLSVSGVVEAGGAVELGALGGVSVDTANLAFTVTLDRRETATSSFDLDGSVTIESAELNDVEIDFGGLFTLFGSAKVHFDAGPDDVLVEIHEVGVRLTEGLSAVQGWGVQAGHVGVLGDGSVVALPDFFVDILFPEGTLFGLPPFIPLTVSRAGAQFTAPAGTPADEPFVIDPSHFLVRGDAGIGGEGTALPFLRAAATGLLVDPFALAGLRSGPILVDIDSVSFGVTEPIVLGPVSVSGGFTIGTTQAGNFFLDLAGSFGMEGVGEMGGRLLIGEHGPIAGELIVPAPIPLGPSGFVLSSVRGGLVFGQEPLRFTDASQLTRSALPGLPAEIGTNAVEALVDAAAVPTSSPFAFWERPVTLAIGANVIYAPAPGTFSGDVELIVNTTLDDGGGLSFAGVGDVKVIGLPFAQALFLLDLRDDPTTPIVVPAPKLFGKFDMPTAGSVLGFLLPAKSGFQFTFDTTGFVEGLVAATRTFVDRVAHDTLDVAGDFIVDVLDVVAENLVDDPTRPLARALFADANLDGRADLPAGFDGARLLDELLDALPGPDLASIQADIARGAELFQGLFAEMFEAAAGLAPDLTGADPTIVDDDLREIVGDGGNALLAILANLREAAIDAATDFEESFNPRLAISGEIQPTLFGFPIGPPRLGGEIEITKDGLLFGFTISPTGLVKDSLENFPGFGQLVKAAEFFLPIPIGLFFAQLGNENLEAEVQLPFGGAFEALARGTLPTIDPFSGDWLVRLSGSLAPGGVEVAEITGALLGGGNNAAVLAGSRSSTAKRRSSRSIPT